MSKFLNYSLKYAKGFEESKAALNYFSNNSSISPSNGSIIALFLEERPTTPNLFITSMHANTSPPFCYFI